MPLPVALIFRDSMTLVGAVGRLLPALQPRAHGDPGALRDN